MPTTLKTPTPTQWKKLCEMADGFAVKEYGHGDTVTMQHPSGESTFPLWALPNDTDALMRLMDAVFTEWSMTCRNVVLVRCGNLGPCPKGDVATTTHCHLAPSPGR